MVARFLFGPDLWGELRARIPKAASVQAAVAYFGAGGSTLLPLRRGDRLVVDMSARSVRAGSTDPREVKKLLRRGVEVFSRDTLHAKFFVLDRVVIAGSSNISKHARDVLDEAAVMSDDPAVVARASIVFEHLSNEPVGDEYLRWCLKEYRPPRFVGRTQLATRRPARSPQAKLWIIGGLSYTGELPAEEQPKAQRLVERAMRQRPNDESFEVESINYPGPEPFFRALRPMKDWVIQCVRHRSGFDVFPPSRVLGVRTYSRGQGKRRYLLLVEQRIKLEPVRWQQLRRSRVGKLRAIDRDRPRTAPICSNEEADALLRLWDTKGRFRGGWR
jgi:hypothetical protein